MLKDIKIGPIKIYWSFLSSSSVNQTALYKKMCVIFKVRVPRTFYLILYLKSKRSFVSRFLGFVSLLTGGKNCKIRGKLMSYSIRVGFWYRYLLLLYMEETNASFFSVTVWVTVISNHNAKNLYSILAPSVCLSFCLCPIIVWSGNQQGGEKGSSL